MNCSICMERIKNKYTISCKHSFCYKCIKKWEKTNNTCPNCREPFSIVPVRTTRSMTKHIREEEIHIQLRDLLVSIKNYKGENAKDDKINTVNKVLKKIYDNPWLFKCEHAVCRNNCFSFVIKHILKDKLNELHMQGLKEATIWQYKFRKYLI